MIALNGIYENGIISLERNIRANKTIKVIVTFLDDNIQVGTKRLTVNDFSFLKAREKSKNYTGSLSDVIIEDRNNER